MTIQDPRQDSGLFGAIPPEWLEEFEAAARRPLMCHPDDIIASKEATNRLKDRESLPRLRSFRDYWKARR